jgi:hypothetical protein
MIFLQTKSGRISWSKVRQQLGKTIQQSSKQMSGVKRTQNAFP